MRRRRPFSVLFICTGNACRSPMAEGLLRRLFASEGIAEVDISSAGTFALEGDTASKLALLVAAEYGVDLSTHRARRLAKKMLRRADVILAMSDEHVVFARNMVARSSDNIYKLKGFDREKAFADSIEDPIGGDVEMYRRVFEEIKREIDRIYPTLRARALEKMR